MALQWIRESPPRWDGDKLRILAVPAGVFDFARYREGDLLPGDWWRVEEDGAVLGYGWMDHTWGDAEILLAVAEASGGHGVGTFILDRFEEEARAQGLNYLYNVIPARHPAPEELARWLEKRGFRPSADGSVLRRSVRRPSGG